MKISAAILVCSLVSVTPALVMGTTTTIAQWTFETSLAGFTGTSGATSTDLGPLAAEIGSGSASGHHATSATKWTSPAGNGSSHSFNSDHWATYDYYQFQISTIGFSDIQVAFDQYGSSTGPRDFNLEYSMDGTVFTTFASYSLLAAGSWNSSSFDLNLITALNNVSTVYFQLIDESATSASGGPVGTTGTDRVDNFIVSGDKITTSVPDSIPGVAGLGCVFGLLEILRRMTRVSSPLPHGTA